jgi:(p)ppGpp synthase/HD superfamily hydrolase
MEKNRKDSLIAELNQNKDKYREIATRYHLDQTYDGKDYVSHLDSVYDVVKQHIDLIGDEYEIDINNLAALSYLHDILEDTEMSEFKLEEMISPEVKEMVANLYVNKAKHIDDYYFKIAKDIHTAYLKLCDRIANVKYSVNNDTPKSQRVLKKYRAEQPIIESYIQYDELQPMLDELNELLFS